VSKTEACGQGSVVDPNSFFSDSDPEIFFGPHCVHMYRYSRTCKTEKKLFALEKNIHVTVFSSKCLISDFSELFPFYSSTGTYLNTGTNPNFFSDSDPAKNFRFFWIRIHNTWPVSPRISFFTTGIKLVQVNNDLFVQGEEHETRVPKNTICYN
jgi:hypothetical protein